MTTARTTPLFCAQEATLPQAASSPQVALWHSPGKLRKSSARQLTIIDRYLVGTFGRLKLRAIAIASTSSLPPRQVYGIV